MKKASVVLVISGALLLFCTSVAKADQLVFDLSGSETRLAFGVDDIDDLNYQAGGTYQQFYSRAKFPGRVRLTEVAFASAPLIGTPGVASYNFVLRLGTAAKSVSAPEELFSANRSADLMTVFAGPLSSVQRRDGTFDLLISFETPFDYNPQAGDLLLDVVIGAPTDYTGSDLYFLAGASDDISSVFSTTPSPVGILDEEFRYGLRTRFTFTSQAAPVPEPTAMLLLGTGLTCIGGMIRKHRRRRKLNSAVMKNLPTIK